MRTSVNGNLFLAMPTFQTFKGGVKVNEVVGASKEKLLELISGVA